MHVSHQSEKAIVFQVIENELVKKTHTVLI